MVKSTNQEVYILADLVTFWNSRTDGIVRMGKDGYVLKQVVEALRCVHLKTYFFAKTCERSLDYYLGGVQMDNTRNALEKGNEMKVKKNANEKAKGKNYVRMLTTTAMLGALATALMYVEISIPIMPGFIKYDISDLPALLGSMAFGPICGMLVCFIKNALHLLDSNSFLVGELSNFLLGAVFVVPVGIMYKKKQNKKTAIIGGVLGAVVMGLFSVVSNYFIIYPIYYKVAMPEDVILGMYQAILPGMKNMLQCLLVFNMPFTIVKGLIATAVAALIYQQVSPLLRGRDL